MWYYIIKKYDFCFGNDYERYFAVLLYMYNFFLNIQEP